jgi:hypothetical protein
LRNQIRSLRMALLEAAVIVGLCAACAGCAAKGSSYVGKWECPAKASEFLEIKANNGAFLITDEHGAT